jgi:multidrug resistance efflux pump
MLELLLCSLLTIFPDYLYRRYRQGKRLGHEITFYSVWFELRWGITACLMLTVALITVIFYFHPSTTTATLFYRTVPIIPDGQIREAKGAYQQASDELDTKRELQKRNPGIVPQRDIEKLEVLLTGRQGALDSATASKQSTMSRVSALLPAERASAEAATAEAQVDLDRTYVRAGVDGRVEQFALRVGDIVNPMIRSAGILIPDGAGRQTLSAGFGQIEAQVMKVGMVAEASCISKPWTIFRWW